MRRKQTYIHEKAGWPTFTWAAEALAAPLVAVRHRQGRLIGRMEALGFEPRAEAGLLTLTREVVKSSAIEGEVLNPDEVRSSIARRLGLDAAGLPPAGREVEGVVEMMLDATRNCAARLTKERLFDWHAALFPAGRSGIRRIVIGAWRPPDSAPMQVVSGAAGRERVHFVAPAADRVEGEMTRFLDWFNSRDSMDLALKAGVAHFWFVTIHPFEDGNGRIARAIADLALARADGIEERFYSMSAQIEAERKDYYRELESAQHGELDLTRWLSWFLGCLERAIASADRTLAAVLYKARLWQRVGRHSIHDRQRLVIARMLDDFQGFLSTSKYAKLAKCSTDTALRDIHELLEYGILTPNQGGGRSTSYRLADLENIDRA